MQKRREARQPRHSAGFTLIEAIVVLAITGVLLCLAVPAFGNMLARHRLATAQLDLLASLQHARGLAVTSGRRTLLCPSSNGQQCSDDTHWEQGWLIGNYRSDRPNQLDGPPQRVGGGHARLIIKSTAGRTRVRFQPNGTSGGSTVTFTLCRPGDPEDALVVKVSNMGRVAGGKADAEQATNCVADG